MDRKFGLTRTVLHPRMNHLIFISWLILLVQNRLLFQLQKVNIVVNHRFRSCLTSFLVFLGVLRCQLFWAETTKYDDVLITKSKASRALNLRWTLNIIELSPKVELYIILLNRFQHGEVITLRIVLVAAEDVDKLILKCTCTSTTS